MKLENLNSIAFSAIDKNKILRSYLNEFSDRTLKIFNLNISKKEIYISTPWNEDIELTHTFEQIPKTKILELNEPLFVEETEIFNALKEKEDPFNVDGYETLYWKTLIENDHYVVDKNLKEIIYNKTEEFLTELVGENDQKIADSGRYVPGSAKERRAISKFIKESGNERKEGDEDAITKLKNSLSLCSDLFRKLYIQKDNGVPQIPFPSATYVLSQIVEIGRRYQSDLSSSKVIPSSAINKISDAILLIYERILDFHNKHTDLNDYINVNNLNSFHEFMSSISKTQKEMEESLENLNNIASSVLSALDHESSTVSWNVRSLCKSLIQMATRYFESDEDTIFEKARGYVYSQIFDRIKKEAVKRAKEMGDYELVAALTKKVYLPTFERGGGRDTSHINSIEDFNTIFGLDARQFGKSLTDKERKELLHRATASLFDLADVLGIEDKQIGVNGALSLAFAARGKPGSIAHYDIQQKIINLNKKDGTDGSLAHEFGHALDYGSNGSSFYDTVREIDDIDIQDAFRKLNTDIFTSNKDDFLKRVEHDIAETEREEAAYRQKYYEEKEKIDKVYDPLNKEYNDLKREILRLRNLISEEEDEEGLNNAELEATRELSDAIYKKLSLLRMDYQEIDIYRIHTNNLARKAFELKKIRRCAENDRHLSELQQSCKMISVIPVNFIESCVTEEKPFYPSTMLWDSALVATIETKKKKDIKKADHPFYWTHPKEMFARAFETYIGSKLEEDNRTNSMLCKPVIEKNGSSVYPQGEQLKKIKESMDEFIRVLKQKKYI